MKSNPITEGWEKVAALHTKCNGKLSHLPIHEQYEITRIMKENEAFWVKVATLRNLSYLAHETNDIEEQHKLCAAIEELEETGYTGYFKTLGKHYG